MVSFTDHCNAISLDRLTSKLNLEKINGTLIISELWYFNKPEFCSTTKNLLFLFKPQKAHSSASDWGRYTSSCLKRALGHLLKLPSLKKKLEFQN